MTGLWVGRSVPFGKIFQVLLWLSLLVLHSHAEWDDPPFEIDPDGLGGITSNDGTNINIMENVGSFLNGFPLARLRLTASHQVTKTGDPRFFVEQEADGQWYLKSSTAFDFESLNDPRFVLRLDLDGGGSDDTELGLLVTVEDENDNIPRVVSQVPDPIPPVPEFSMMDNPIVTIIAIDDDVADNSRLIFQLEEFGGGESFEVNQKGEVYLKRQLDYSQRTSHRLNIIIDDPRPPDHSVLASVTVIVEDIPNIPPEFIKPPIIRSVTEEIPIGTLIATAEARDGDFGLNWPIQYSIVDDVLELFEIDEDTGVITVKSRIDAEDARLIELDLSYSFTVVAREIYDHEFYPDLPPELTEASVEVAFAILDINDQPPILCADLEEDPTLCREEGFYSFEIPEDHSGPISMAGDLIIRVRDLDSTPTFNRFSASFADDTEEIIKRAFRFTPALGMIDREFVLVVNERDAIDFENGEWYDQNGNLVSKNFTIEFTGTADSSHIARAHFRATVTDVNDNSPVFQIPDGQSEYTFLVCENTENGQILRQVVLPSNPEYPNSCMDSVLGDELTIFALDDDITPAYGSESIIYRWSAMSRQPPIVLGSKTGTMTMNAENGNGFDYERFREEIFIVEAVDNEGGQDGLVAAVPVRFTILDRNDETVDLRFGNGYRVTIKENTTMTEPILSGITATDVDETGKITYSMTISSIFTKVGVQQSDNDFARNYKQIEVTGELEDMIKDWFSLEELDGGTDRSKQFQIVLGNELPDREGYGELEIDRVDLIVAVEDVNSETGPQIASQVVTIFIEDLNDNPPEWLEGYNANFSVSVLETEIWGDEGDTSSELEREIYTLRVADRDMDTHFQFFLSSEGCLLSEEICQEILDMFELSISDSIVGATTLCRKQGMEIDRERREHFLGDSDILNITIVTSDGVHQLSSKLHVTVEDRNDNVPEFIMDYSKLEYSVDENVETSMEIVKIVATDKDRPDKYGKVSYLLGEDNGNGKDKFNISLDGGEITAIPGAYEWFDIQQFRLEVTAIDYYRESSSAGSNMVRTYIVIKVLDKNNHAPEFLTDGGSSDNPFLEIGESEVEIGVELATVLLQDKDDPSLDNGRISVLIEDVEKEPPVEDPTLKDWFSLELIPGGDAENTNKLLIFATRDFRGLSGNYSLKLKAFDGESSDPSQFTTEAVFHIRITNDNLH